MKEMRSVLGRMTTGATGNILTFANSRDGSLTESLSVAAKTREGRSVMRKRKILSRY